MPLRDILTIRTFWEIASRFCVVLLLELACLKGDDDDVDCFVRSQRRAVKTWIAALWLARTDTKTVGVDCFTAVRLHAQACKDGWAGDG